MKPSSIPFLLALAVLPAQGAEPLGRLFYTPAERATLERQKKAATGGGEVGAPTTLNGVVRRSSGRDTVWINGTPAEEKSVEARRSQRVGETLAPSGEVSDPLQGGTIVIRRKPGP